MSSAARSIATNGGRGDIEALRRLKKLKEDFPAYAEQCLVIRDKDGTYLPFKFNNAQIILHHALEEQMRRMGKIRALVLKGRQQGISTYVAARFYQRAGTHKGVNVYILAHEQPASDSLFSMVERYHDNNPLAPHTGTANAKELRFDKLDSGYIVATAGQKAGGRSRTTTLMHGCLAPETRIIEPNGNARRMDSFRVGDLVRTHTGEVAPVSFISRQLKQTLRFKVQGVNEPMVATPGHRFWTPEGKRQLADLRAGDCIGYPVAKFRNTTPRWKYRRESDWRKQGGGTQAVGPEWVQGTYDVGRILGLYLAEGCLIRQSNSGTPAGICLAIHEREVERTVQWLAPLRDGWRSEPKVAHRKDSKTCTVSVYSRSFAEFVLARCGELSEKHVPSEWFESVCFSQGLLHGYLSGDGHSDKRPNNRRISAPSIRSAISFGMRDIAASLGYGWAGVVYRKGGIRNGRNEKAQWTFRLTGEGVDKLCRELGWKMPPRKRAGRSKVTFSEGYAWVPIQWIKDADQQEVMDFEVDHPDHSYLTWQGASSNSEVAFWTNASEHFMASVQTVPDRPGTEIILESTAYGPTGEFYERWQEAVNGETEYLPVFIPWFVQEEYKAPVPDGFQLSTDSVDGQLSEAKYAELFGLSNAQMMWRRNKIKELRSSLRFDQEYPATSEMAFVVQDVSSFIRPVSILEARKRTGVEPAGTKILGIDPSGAGKDRFAVAFRQGYVVPWLRFRRRLETGEALAWIRSMIEEVDPDLVFMDAGGLGGPILSAIRSENAHFSRIIKGVNFGGKSEHKLASKHVPGPGNRRAEMYLRLKEWFELEEGVSIPDDDAIQRDLCSVQLRDSVSNDVFLESKRDAPQSYDLGDALALTFATLRVSRMILPVHKSRERAADEREIMGDSRYSSSPDNWMR